MVITHGKFEPHQFNSTSWRELYEALSVNYHFRIPGMNQNRIKQAPSRLNKKIETCCRFKIVYTLVDLTSKQRFIVPLVKNLSMQELKVFNFQI